MWSKSESGVTCKLNDISFDGKKYVVIGDNGTIIAKEPFH